MTESRALTEFRALSWREKSIEYLLPHRKRERKARLREEIRRLVVDAPNEPIVICGQVIHPFTRRQR